MKALRSWRVATGILAGAAVALLPATGLLWWNTRQEWFPMRVGDLGTYVDPNIPDKVVFEAVRTEEGAFVVERRVGSDRTTFVLSVTPDSVFILGTSTGAFEPPFEEFRLPPVSGMTWTYRGEFGGRSITVQSEVEPGSGPRRSVVERGPHGWTRFDLERGRGVVKLQGKGSDPHGFGDRHFDWTLESFERRG